MTDGATDRTGTTKVGRTRRWAGALLLGGTLAVLAAALVGLSISASSRSPASITREPLELHPKGDFTHPAGFLMPEKAGPFERVEVLQYDEAGRNLSAGYNAVVGGEMPLPIFVTLYGPRQFVGRYAVFGYEEPWGGVADKVPLRSYLVVYRWNGWWVKWRATTPAPVSPERMKAIVDLTESLLPPEIEPDELKEPSDDDAERLAEARASNVS